MNDAKHDKLTAQLSTSTTAHELMRALYLGACADTDAQQAAQLMWRVAGALAEALDVQCAGRRISDETRAQCRELLGAACDVCDIVDAN